MKIQCTKCLIYKEEIDFPVHKTKNGPKRRYNCRDCYNSYFRKYLNNNSHRKVTLERYHDKKQAIAEIKLKEGCKICKYNKCVNALEFHHLDRTNKIDNVSQMWKYKDEIILNEMSKCIILCANCHREIESGLIDINALLT